MAAECPKCNTAVPDFAFGIYACSNCKTVLSIDFDGNVTFAEDGSEFQPEPIKEKTVTKKFDLTKESTRATSVEPIGGELDVEPAGADLDLMSTPSNTAAGPELKLAAPEKESQELPGADLPPYKITPSKAQDSKPNFKDVVAFANSDVSAGAEGSFLYDVLIAGIDSEDLRQAVREALEDSRFGWSADDVIGKLKGGTILLTRLNAVKAAVLVGRLKGFPLEITWQQTGIFEVVTDA